MQDSTPGCNKLLRLKMLASGHAMQDRLSQITVARSLRHMGQVAGAAYCCHATKQYLCRHACIL